MISGRRITHLQVATAEDTLIQNQGLGHETRLGEFDVGITVKTFRQCLYVFACLLIEDLPLWLAGEFVQEDSDPIDRTAALEVCLDLLG